MIRRAAIPSYDRSNELLPPGRTEGILPPGEVALLGKLRRQMKDMGEPETTEATQQHVRLQPGSPGLAQRGSALHRTNSDFQIITLQLLVRNDEGEHNLTSRFQRSDEGQQRVDGVVAQILNDAKHRAKARRVAVESAGCQLIPEPTILQVDGHVGEVGRPCQPAIAQPPMGPDQTRGWSAAKISISREESV